MQQTHPHRKARERPRTEYSRRRLYLVLGLRVLREALDLDSNNLISALGAKLGTGFELAPTLGAFVFRPQWLPAFWTELCPLGVRRKPGKALSPLWSGPIP